MILDNLPGNHVFWTAPKQGKPHLHDFEIVTAIASALYYQLHSGSLTLWTDKPGLQYFSRLGLLSMYYDVRHLRVPPFIDPKIFWAAGKLYAYANATVPSMFLDLDAILFKPLTKQERLSDVVALHDEPRDWPAYQRTWDEFPEGYWSTGRPWPDQSIKPINVGILGLFNDQVRRQYITSAFDFIRSFVESGLPPKYVDMGAQKSVCIDEMVFAEQFLLPVVIRRYSWSVRFLGQFDRNLDHLAPNDRCAHLWNSKHHYQTKPDIRKRYTETLMTRLIVDFGDRAKKLFHSSGVAAGMVIDHNAKACRFFQSALYERLLPGETIEMFGP